MKRKKCIGLADCLELKQLSAFSVRFTFITASFLACAGVSIETNVNNFLIGPNVIKFQENVQNLSWRY